MGISNRNREESHRQLTNQDYDLLVIGGGLTGASIALDASSRGMKVALIEQKDYGNGASAQFAPLLSTHHFPTKKIWHQAYTEKQLLAEHLSPFYKPVNMLTLVYDHEIKQKLLSKLRHTLSESLISSYFPKHLKLLSKKEVQMIEANVSERKLKYGFSHQDGVIDQCLMTIEILKKAYRFGTNMINYLKLVQFIYNDEQQVTGVLAEDQVTGEVSAIYASKIVNATGSQVESVSQLDKSDDLLKSVAQYRKRIQLFFNQSDLAIDHTISFTDVVSQQMITLTPYQHFTMLTVSEPTSSILQQKTVSEDEFTHIVRALKRVIPHLCLDKSQVIEQHVAYLINQDSRGTGDIITSTSGLITAIGAPIVFYRSYASQVVDRIAKDLKRTDNILYSKSETKSMAIIIDDQGDQLNFKSYLSSTQLSDKDIAFILARYGNQVSQFLPYLDEMGKTSKNDPLEPMLSLLLRYALDHEGIYKPIDFLSRRLRYQLYRPFDMQQQLKPFLQQLASALAWTKEECSYYERECRLWLNAHQASLEL
ncbi:FAD-dependent oxidoreductase [Amphibacillus cookii]|uniref:FAD-dependent oxidoreductase n=1 Tax=Amphibacillus cookii TaxID=767787 RepID=UPI0019574B33|nr:FAD-dependent oxidoreductase [Amphibacillus cookii]MBM7541525.1 glycerol-3-phosphate dehydrogenase [Amphibacillus cookii]